MTNWLADLLTFPPGLYPVRVQRRMTPGWRKPVGDIQDVTRPGPWGNHFRIGQPIHVGPAWDTREVMVRDARHACRLYYQWVLGSARRAGDLLPPLAGRQLMCWCPLPAPGQPDWCHGAVLTLLANRHLNEIDLALNPTLEGVA